METLLQIGPSAWAVVMMVALLAGVVKGVVGFAMPMILISGLGSVISPELALAGLILPTVVANLWQALRQGWRAAWGSVRAYWVFLGVGFVVLMAAAQLVPIMPKPLIFLLIGIPVTLYAGLGVMGIPPRLPGGEGRRGEATMAVIAGFFGGISGVWGPPTVAMLTARGTGKADQMRIQGVIYGLGSVALLWAHMVSGVLDTKTAPLSLLLVAPAILGLWLGFHISDRIDHKAFRKLTLLVLLIAGLNLIRRGIMAF